MVASVAGRNGGAGQSNLCSRTRLVACGSGKTPAPSRGTQGCEARGPRDGGRAARDAAARGGCAPLWGVRRLPRGTEPVAPGLRDAVGRAPVVAVRAALAVVAALPLVDGTADLVVAPADAALAPSIHTSEAVVTSRAISPGHSRARVRGGQSPPAHQTPGPRAGRRW